MGTIPLEVHPRACKTGHYEVHAQYDTTHEALYQELVQRGRNPNLFLASVALASPGCLRPHSALKGPDWRDWNIKRLSKL